RKDSASRHREAWSAPVSPVFAPGVGSLAFATISERHHRSTVVRVRDNERSCEMSILKPVRILGAVAIMASVPPIAASAQSLPPAPSEPPAASRPETPLPHTLPTQKPLVTPQADKSVTPPAKVHPLIGLAVFS